jgi:hypothetical protein
MESCTPFEIYEGFPPQGPIEERKSVLLLLAVLMNHSDSAARRGNYRYWG